MIEDAFHLIRKYHTLLTNSCIYCNRFSGEGNKPSSITSVFRPVKEHKMI